MATTSAAGPKGPVDNPEVAHEYSDVNVRGILWFIVILLVVAVVIHVAIWVLFEAFESRAAAADPAPAPLARPAGQLPPAPRLQWHPADQLRDLRDREDALLHADEAGRIPIDRAKRLVVEKGLLPVR